MPAASPFTEPLVPPAAGLLDRMLGRSQAAVAEYELVRLLAASAIDDLSSRRISELLGSLRLSGSETHALLVKVWSHALEAFLADDALSDDELDYLNKLRRLFDLGESDIVAVENRLIHPRLQKVISEIMADHTVSPEERDALVRIGSALRVSPALQNEMFNQAATKLMKDLVNDSMADRRLSPAEAEELKAAAANLGLDLSFDSDTREQLSRFALLWRIENGDLPTVPVRIKLAKDETCHFSCRGSWHEPRKNQPPPGAGQPDRIRVGRGIYYRLGGAPPQSLAIESMSDVDAGTLYLTNKRLVFDGRARNLAIKLQSIVAFDVFRDGLAVNRGGSPTPHFLLDGDVELAALILSRLLAVQ